MFWSIGDGPRSAGRIELDADHVSLLATTPTPEVARIGFRDLSRVLLVRSVLHLERRGDVPVQIGSLDTPGALRELADRLAGASQGGVG
jgi:hypothetical protein